MQPNERTTIRNGAHILMEAVGDELTKGVPAVESLATIAHRARDLVTALELYCEMLDAPGVLASPHLHYRDGLRLLVSTSRRLMGRLTALENAERNAVFVRSADHGHTPSAIPTDGVPRAQCPGSGHCDLLSSALIKNIGVQLIANRNLLAVLAGPAIRVTMDVQDADLPVRMTGEDLTRVLIHLVENSVEAMPQGGSIHLSLRETPNRLSATRWLTLTVEDNGTGIPFAALGRIFRAGYTTRSTQAPAPNQPSAHRGLGLSITRSIVKAAGGRIHAANRDSSGACFQIELPAGAC